MKYIIYVLPLSIILFFVSCQLFQFEVGIITSPYDGAGIAGIQTVLVTPPQDILVDYVDFYIDGQFRYEDTTDPYEWEWDTSGETNGPHTVYVELNGLSGEFITDSIQVTVLEQ